MDTTKQFVKDALARATVAGTATPSQAPAAARVYETTENNAREVAAKLAEFPAASKTTEDIVQAMDLAPTDRPKILRWLKAAASMGLVHLIETPGVRGFQWRASDAVLREHSRKQLLKPLEQRPKVGYNSEFLESYVPGRTHYLSDEVRKRLHDRSKPGTAAFHELSQHDRSVFLCGLSHGSSALEGSQYSRLETIKLIQEGLAKKGASQKETFMVMNHHDAVRYIVENMHYPALSNDVSVSTKDLCDIHALLSYHLLDDENMCGAVRSKAVTIWDCAFTPLAFHDDIVRCLHQICVKAREIPDPFEAAFFLLVHLPYLQPFEDCNKRTSRVACNIPLLRRGVLPMSWVETDASQYGDGIIAVYEQNSPALLAEVFYEGYMRSSEEFEAIRVRQSDGPSDIALRYRSDIKKVVRSVVQEGSGAMPENIEPADQERFSMVVRAELERIARMHRGTMIQYGVSEQQVLAWRERDGQADAPAAEHLAEDDEGAGVLAERAGG